MNDGRNAVIFFVIVVILIWATVLSLATFERIDRANFNKEMPWKLVVKDIYVSSKGSYRQLLKVEKAADCNLGKGIQATKNGYINNTPPVYQIQHVSGENLVANDSVWPIAKGQKRANATAVEIYNGEAHFLNK